MKNERIGWQMKVGRDPKQEFCWKRGTERKKEGKKERKKKKEREGYYEIVR